MYNRYKNDVVYIFDILYEIDLYYTHMIYKTQYEFFNGLYFRKLGLVSKIGIFL